MPPNPTTIAKMKEALEKNETVRDRYCVLTNGDRFFDCFVETKKYAFCIFSTKSSIRLIKDNNLGQQVLIDGTFSIVPKGPFYQVLVLSVAYKTRIYPFAFALMSRKSTACYRAMFKYIHNNLLPLDKCTFTTDYELAMRNSLRSLFPHASFFACHFHFCQAIKKRAYKMGMASVIRGNDDVRMIYYQCQNIPLLPIKHIPTAFDCIKKSAESVECIQPFLKYYESQWLITEGAKNISVNSAIMRTTSAVESMNHTLSKSIVQRGGFYTFLGGLCREAYNFWLDLDESIQAGGLESRSASTLQEKDEFIGALTKKLNTNKITEMEFLRRYIRQYKQTALFKFVSDIDNIEGYQSDEGSDADEHIGEDEEQAIAETFPNNVCEPVASVSSQLSHMSQESGVFDCIASTSSQENQFVLAPKDHTERRHKRRKCLKDDTIPSKRRRLEGERDGDRRIDKVTKKSKKTNKATTNTINCYTINCDSNISFMFSCKHMFCYKCFHDGPNEIRRRRRQRSQERDENDCIVSGCEGHCVLTFEENFEV